MLDKTLELAVRYGPFFFSLYFLQRVTRWAYTNYQKALEHSPTLPAKDIATQRYVWVGSFIFGVVLVSITVWWWLVYRPITYSFVGHIKNLQQYEELVSDDLYFRPHFLPTLPGDQSLLRNVDFLATQAAPFQKGQAFEVDYSKQGGPRTVLTFTYDPADAEPRFEIQYDEQSQKTVLKSVNAKAMKPQPVNAWLRTEVVYAQERSAVQSRVDQGKPGTVFSTKSSSSAKSSLGAFKKLPTKKPVQQDKAALDQIRVLSDERQDVGAKIAAIESLQTLDPSVIRPYLSIGDKEPFSITLLDLTRHSDHELAAKATVLSKRLDMDGYVVQQLSSNNLEDREAGEAVLLRISNAHAQQLLSRVNTKAPDLQKTAQDVKLGNVQLLQPTGSINGDRYYVKVTWDPARSDVVSCLTRVFNQNLASNRTLDEEKKLMQGLNQRYVYWYDKEWAIDVAHSIKTCGADAQFVRPYLP